MAVTTRYRLEGVIGIGASGPVHRAVAERLGARPIALRSADVAAGAARHELRRRAEAIAVLGCPHLAVVGDIVELDGDRVQLAGTLGHHGSLADRLVLGPLRVDEAVAVVGAVVDALSAAHGAGLVHGHLSPTNVVFGDLGPIVTDLVVPPAGRVRVADDIATLAGLAAALIAPDDPSPAGAVYRSLWARVAADPTVPLTDIARALARVLARVPSAATPRRAPQLPPARVGSPAPALTTAAVATAVGLAAGVGCTIGAAATWLGALAG